MKKVLVWWNSSQINEPSSHLSRCRFFFDSRSISMVREQGQDLTNRCVLRVAQSYVTVHTKSELGTSKCWVNQLLMIIKLSMSQSLSSMWECIGKNWMQNHISSDSYSTRIKNLEIIRKAIMCKLERGVIWNFVVRCTKGVCTPHKGYRSFWAFCFFCFFFNFSSLLANLKR